MSNLLEKIIKNVFFPIFWTVFPFFMPKSESRPSLFAQSLFFKELHERIDHIDLYKRAKESRIRSEKPN